MVAYKRLALQDEEEIFEAEDLFYEINRLTQKVVAPDEEENNKKDIKEKLERYKNIMVKKDKIIKEATEVTKTLKLSIATIKHDNAMMSEIQENDKITIEETKKEKEIQQKEITKLEKSNEAIKTELETTRDMNATLNKNNSTRNHKMSRVLML